MRKAVVDLSSSRPIWSIPSGSVQAIRDAFGPGWALVQVTAPTSGDAGASGHSAEAEAAATGAEVYFGWGIGAGVVKMAGQTLGWVHTAAAGVGSSLTPELRASGANLTNSRGIHAEPMADWVVAAIGFCGRGFHLAVAAQSERRWAVDQFTGAETPVRELRDLSVGILGMGGVGRAIAQRCAALGMTVRAVRRRPNRDRPPGVVWVGGPGDLNELARESDVLVIAAPHTAETVRVVDDSVLGELPAGAYVLNVSRGALLDERALSAHLDAGRLGGCVLDVVATEPLPESHPFWDHELVFITPHVSGVTPGFWKREIELITDNVERYLNGRPLRNIVDLEAGY